MSNLINRTSRRKMNRPNMDKALARIERELFEVISASPVQPQARRTIAMGRVRGATRCIKALWEKDE